MVVSGVIVVAPSRIQLLPCTVIPQPALDLQFLLRLFQESPEDGAVEGELLVHDAGAGAGAKLARKVRRV
jgi:hypothetical protein